MNLDKVSPRPILEDSSVKEKPEQESKQSSVKTRSSRTRIPKSPRMQVPSNNKTLIQTVMPSVPDASSSSSSSSSTSSTNPTLSNALSNNVNSSQAGTKSVPVFEIKFGEKLISRSPFSGFVSVDTDLLMKKATENADKRQMPSQIARSEEEKVISEMVVQCEESLELFNQSGNFNILEPAYVPLMTAVFLAGKVNEKIQKEIFELITNFQKKGVDLLSVIVTTAFQSGDLAVLNNLRKFYPDLNFAKGLSLALSSLSWRDSNPSSHAILKLVLKDGGKLPNSYDIEALQLKAIHCNDVELMQILLEKGNCSKNRATYLLAEASYVDEMALVKLLLDQGANVNAVDNKGKSILWNACESNNVELVKFLLDQYPDLNFSPKVKLDRDLIPALKNNLNDEICEVLQKAIEAKKN